ncbi:MAG: methyltransferase domain-containing protein [Micromonosporaceae bacterium]|nr:methyltransferase domain-containing protein [Micromonosporaceae bacterium]
MRLAEAFEQLVGPDSPVEFVGYDSSRAGAPGADLRIEVRSPRALQYLVRAPGELGLARAYVAGDLEVHGDMHDALSRLMGMSGTFSQVPTRRLLRMLREFGGVKLLRRVPPPDNEVRLSGRRHSKLRDEAAISHHYDVSNTFYEWVLGPSMTYTCAVYPEPDATLETAQWTKYELVARKLDLKPGMRLLDVGCGWGGMVRHAAKAHGVKALGVTLSGKQAEWAQKAIAEDGLQDLAEVRHCDYRDVAESDFDVVSSIGLTEHVGKDNLPAYFQFLYEKLAPQGRLLNHCITRPNGEEPAYHSKGFINRYVFPDGELESIGHLVSVMHDIGFDVRHEENLREHYAKTLTAWCENLEEHWDEAVAEVGAQTARVWRLYMAGSRLGFDRNWIQLHQVLAAKPDENGCASMPLRPTW